MITREIKFRVWDDVLKVMFSPDNQIGNLWSIKEAPNGVIKYDRGILMQFTGLKDQTGKEIYEGDVLQYSDFNYLVEFKDGSWLMKDYAGLTQYRANHIEIIGNIHENPELI